MSVNCFSFNPFSGVTEGLPVSENVPTGRNDGTFHPPHIRCGEGFIRVDFVHAPEIADGVGGKRVMSASVRTVSPTNGGRDFNVLSTASKNPGILVMVSLRSTDRRVHEKGSWVDAWEAIVADDECESVMVGGGCGLFWLSESGQEIDLFSHDGSVHRLVFREDTLKTVPLTHKEMAKLRVDQFNSQLNNTSDDRLIHGILWGAQRLLRLSQGNPEVREIFSEFLSQNLEHMNDKLRSSIRTILANAGDRYAGNFLEGYNVISLSSRRATDDSKAKLAESKKKRAERRARDRAFCDRKRSGVSSGKKVKAAK